MLLTAAFADNCETVDEHLVQIHTVLYAACWLCLLESHPTLIFPTMGK